jgi:hypothetical protein
MTRQTITPGKAPIVWSTVEEAFTKINANFTELYASIGDAGSIGFDALETDLIPSQNDTYDLGAPLKRWSNLYLNGTILIGGAVITSEGLTVNLPSGTRVGGDLIIDPDKSFFKEVTVNSETSIVANDFNDSINFEGGTGIRLTTNSSADTVIFDNIGVTSLVAGTAISISGATGAVTVNNTGVTSITAGLGMSRNTATGAVTIVNTGIIDVDAGVGISVGARDPVTGKVIVTNTAPVGNAYRIFATSGEPSLTARSSGDTLTFIEGAGINITNTAASGSFTNRITLDNTGVLSLTAGAGINVSATTGAVTVSFNNRTDIIGSVFADDSTMLVDGTNGVLRGQLIGSLTGNVTGNTAGVHTGTVSGNVTGNVLGNVTGNVTGNLTGYQTGDMTGSVFGQDSTKLIDGVESKLVGPVDTNTVTASSYIQTAVYVDLTAIAAALPTPSKGMIVFDDGTNQFRGFDGSTWVALN